MARTKDPKLELIAAVPLFAGFNRREIEALGRLMDEIDVKEGRVLTREGAPGREFFIVVSGRVRVERNGRKVNELGPGDFLGEIAPISGARRTATVTTAAPSRLLVLTDRAFREITREMPSIQTSLLRALSERLQADAL
jgi:CRP/FNR family transcriptional regulator, cyclic AMP receptor protein